ncbi:MAG: ribosome biogenesis GTPase Der [Gammaproteobacteria bacterium]|nr:ribosome biogenesis GTPase Der [Gammaproteobacteria bacterium]NBT45151.1 ribosome biogenesis GTPase Der [Gammaproteobacteria bacterium]NBY22096.1 ribosome biogenesis GTPase Der [Gammaproteobacteria bacterium]
MLPVVALVGRPNVGKSTLFNYLTRTRDALVADYPGLTRDRQYGRVKRGQRDYFVVDTGGIVETDAGIDEQAMRQVQIALKEADVILFLVDARDGLNVGDEVIAERLRRTGKPVILTANKIDQASLILATADFHALALGEPQPISASHAQGIESLLDLLESRLPSIEELPQEEEGGIRIAIVGRPNVGKSTLVNRLLGEERVVVFDAPGTTRDSVEIPFERHGQRYTLIDTAGIRRRGKIAETVEKFSVIKAMQAIEKAHVVIYLLDAREGVTDQDTNLLGMVLEIGRGLIVGFNKWDGMTQDQRDETRRRLDLKLEFVDFAEKYFISALHGTGVGHLFDAVKEVFGATMTDMGTSHLTRLLQTAVNAHQPPLVRGRRIKLKYAHQGGTNPPTVVIHGNQVQEIPGSYKRYLINYFRNAMAITGTPIKLEFKASENPFKGKRNVLTERQIKKRRRMIRHVK